MSRQKRPTREYLDAAQRLAKFVPSLRKYKKRKTLTQYEKSAIARREKQLAGYYHLTPLTPKQYRIVRKAVPAPGVHAIQLQNTGKDVTIRTVDEDIFITSNGRIWAYWHLDRLEDGDDGAEEMNEAGEKVFGVREGFPVEKIIRLAEEAFKNPTIKAIGLWTERGRVGEAFQTIKQFQMWLFERWNTYQNVEQWVNGIAILIAERNEKIPDLQNMWTFSSRARRKQ